MRRMCGGGESAPLVLELPLRFLPLLLRLLHLLLLLLITKQQSGLLGQLFPRPPHGPEAQRRHGRHGGHVHRGDGGHAEELGALLCVRGDGLGEAQQATVLGLLVFGGEEVEESLTE